MVALSRPRYTGRPTENRMPRKLVVEYTCDRCGRIWYEGYKEGEDPPDVPSLKCELNAPDQGKPVRQVNFEAVCDSCYQTVINLIDSMDKLEKKSPKPRAKKSAPKGAPAAPATPRDPDTSSAGSTAKSIPATRR